MRFQSSLMIPSKASTTATRGNYRQSKLAIPMAWGCTALLLASLSTATWLSSATFAPPEPTTIRLQGTVTEAGTGLAVKGIEVRAATLEAKDGFVSVSSRASAAAPALSDVNGRFELFVDGPGEYELRAQGDGYGSPGPELDAFEPAIHVEVKRGAKELTGLSIAVSRPAAFSGRVIDEKTHAPLRGFSVFAAARSQRVMLDGEFGVASTTTDVEGGYRLTKLAPAPYRIRLEPPVDQRPAIAAGEVDLDEKPATEGYCTTWWPGVDQRGQAGTQGLVSGQELDLGSIPALRCRSFTVAVRVSAPECTTDDRMEVQLRALDGRSGATAALPCGTVFHISRVTPGDYQLLLSSSAGGSRGRLRGILTFTAIPKNMRLDVPLTRGDRTCGVVKFPESRREGVDFGPLRVRINPPGGIRFASDRAAGVDGEGQFCQDGVGPWEHRIFVEGLPAGMYVKQILCNGAAVGKTWTPVSVALAHNLEIALAEGVARVEGTVMNGKTPVADSRVFLARWPLEEGNLRDQLRWTWTSADGRFVFDSIAPGDYRVFASCREAAASWTAESAVAQLQIVKTIKVGDGEARTLRIGSLAY